MADFTLEPAQCEMLLAAVERLHSLTVAFNAWVARNGYQPIATSENLLTGVYLGLRRLQGILRQLPDMQDEIEHSPRNPSGRGTIALVEILVAATNTLDASLPMGMRIGDDLRPTGWSAKNQPTPFSVLAVDQLGLAIDTLKGKPARRRPVRRKTAKSKTELRKPARKKPAAKSKRRSAQ